MASLPAFTQNSISIAQSQFANALWLKESEKLSTRNNKWTYLIANKLNFKQKISHGIRITKPEPEKLMLWLEKIITSQQCKNLYVEQLSVDAMSFKRLKQLCVEFNVSLINITFSDDTNNVIQGPW